MPSRLIQIGISRNQKWTGGVAAVLMLAGMMPLLGCAVPQVTDQSGLAWTRPSPETDGPGPLAWSAGAGVSGLDKIPQASPPRPLVAASDHRAPQVTPDFPAQRLFQEKGAAQAVNTVKPEVLHVSSSTFDQHVLRSEVPVLVDFYADWCGPCKALAPALEQVAAENPQARVVKVNIDSSPELAARYNVKSVPRLLVFKGGQIAAQQSGVASKTRLNAMLAL
jgi:thioredoxin 1